MVLKSDRINEVGWYTWRIIVVGMPWLTTTESIELKPSDPLAVVIAKHKRCTLYQLRKKSTEGIMYNDALILVFSLALMAYSAVCWVEFSKRPAFSVVFISSFHAHTQSMLTRSRTEWGKACYLMLMKHKPSQYLVMPHALLNSVFYVHVCVCFMCEGWLQYPGMAGPHCSWTGLSEMMPGAFTPGTGQNRREELWPLLVPFWVKKKFYTVERGWRDRQKRKDWGGAAEREREGKGRQRQKDRC